MMQMEIDDHTTSAFPGMVRTCSKRGRSESPHSDLGDRKRLKHLVTDDLLQPPLTASSATSSRFSSEDWVKQADGLRLDSPMSGFQDYGSEHGAPSDDMEMDDDIQAVQRSPSLPPSMGRRAQAQATIDGPHPLREGHVPHTSSLWHTAGALSTEATLMPRDFAVHASAGHSNVDSGVEVSMDDLGNKRKPKFTMGPRADCEKCRMGVKGHWMHFD
ncbi:hypothetical protein HGRIS_013203 [Hohenbuehelia grisea]|uniref:Uncharacterized protein n=1 Tax=Hohenbuehelia grisea TaxID=104357 RepID=A0ABR3IUS5_9AGAR